MIAVHSLVAGLYMVAGNAPFTEQKPKTTHMGSRCCILALIHMTMLQLSRLIDSALLNHLVIKN